MLKNLHLMSLKPHIVWVCRLCLSSMLLHKHWGPILWTGHQCLIQRRSYGGCRGSSCTKALMLQRAQIPPCWMRPLCNSVGGPVTDFALGLMSIQFCLWFYQWGSIKGLRCSSFILYMPNFWLVWHNSISICSRFIHHQYPANAEQNTHM